MTIDWTAFGAGAAVVAIPIALAQLYLNFNGLRPVLLVTSYRRLEEDIVSDPEWGKGDARLRFLPAD